MARAGCLVGAVTLAASACSRPSTPGEPAAGSSAPPPSGSTAARAAPRPSAPPAAPPPAVEHEELPESTAAVGASSDWIVDTPVPVAPAGPATASRHGLVLALRDGGAAVARLRAAQPTAKTPTTTAIEPLEVAPSALYARAPRPAVAGDAAYFIHGGRLRRVALPAGGASTELASEARDGGAVAATVASTANGKARTAVAFLADAGTRLVAKLWVEGSPSLLTLTPDGSEASTMALAAHGSEVIAVTLEARTGMSTVHARRVALGTPEPQPAEDVVVWVGGSAQAITEVAALAGAGDDSWAFTAIEHDAAHFGLARIRVAHDPENGAEVFWRDYPNGADPAPLAVGNVCDERVILYARPADPAPRAPQQLLAAVLGKDGLGPARMLVGAPAFANVSIAALPHGALVGYVAEGRTWATTLRCSKP